MTWCFRLRFHLPDRRALQHDGGEWVVLDEPPQRVALVPDDGQETLATARTLALCGSGYDTQGRAETTGQQWRDWFTLALASTSTGVDFGDRAPTGGGLTRTGLQTYQAGVAGVVVEAAGAGRRGVGHQELSGALARARATSQQVTTGQQLAYDLFSTAQAQSDTATCFILLVMAVEALIEQRPPSPATQDVITELVEEVKASGLLAEERSSLLGSLHDLRKRESVGQAGRRLAAGVGDHLTPLLGEDPVKFFTRCYALRSDLVHGNDLRPGREDLSGRAAHLEVFVSHLISKDLPDQE